MKDPPTMHLYRADVRAIKRHARELLMQVAAFERHTSKPNSGGELRVCLMDTEAWQLLKVTGRAVRRYERENLQ